MRAKQVSRQWMSAAFAVCIVLATAVHVWAQSAALSNGAVDPATGDVSTVFKFAVTYTDPAGNAPDMGMVVIDQRAALRLRPPSTGTPDYTLGVVFERDTKLPPGDHTFRFVFMSGGTRLLFPGPTRSDTIAGPTVPMPPLSISGQVRTTANKALAGVTVNALQNNAVVASATTGADGTYKIDNLAAGRYVVQAALTDYRFLPRQRRLMLPPSERWASFLAIPPDAQGGLTDGSVDPASGTPDTNFTFQVTYTNSLNEAPLVALVVIDSEQTMRMHRPRPKIATMVQDPNNSDFTKGVVYTYQTTLPVGQYHFRFAFATDHQKWVWPGPTMMDSQSGPTVNSTPGSE